MKTLQLLFVFILFTTGLKAQLSDQFTNYIQRSSLENPLQLIQEIEQTNSTETEDIILLGELYFYAGNNSKAEQITDAGIKILETKKKENSLLYARALSNKGLILWNDGKYQKSSTYLKEVLRIQEEIGADDLTLSETYNNLGLVTKGTNSSEASKYFKQALRLLSKESDYSQKEAFITINLALIDRENGDFKGALRRLNVILQEWKMRLQEQLPTEAFINLNLGEIYAQLDDFILAEDHIAEAIAIYKTFYGQKNSELANAYMLLGRVYLQQGLYVKALAADQKALISNSIGFNEELSAKNPAAIDAIKANYQMAILTDKAIIYEKYYFAYSLKKEHLLAALQALEAADKLVLQLRRNTSNKTDLLTLNKSASKIYEAGQRICLYLDVIILLDKGYSQRAFQFSEKAKASSLLNAVAESDAKAFGNVPNDKLIEENRLKNTLSYYSTNLSKANSTDALKTVQAQLFNAQKAYEEFITQLEKDYPAYHGLKHSKSIASVEETQMYLQPTELLISYSYDLESNIIYQYIIGNDSFEVNTIYDLDEVQRLLKAYRNILTYQLKEPYEQIAYQLYKKLIPKRIGKEIKEIIIIPEGELGIIPFEAFVVQVNEGDDFRTYNYLIKNYAISYNYSATLHSRAKPFTSRRESLVIAPVTFKDPKVNSLPSSEIEAVNISTMLENKGYNNTLYTFNNASEENFRSPKSSAYEFIHLATHGLVNPDKPDLSAIYLNSATDSTQDGKLYVGEIYNLKLNTNLLCLSACETGIGKYSRGEGILGLGRAFSYAGAQKIVVSLWNVNDASTAIFMENFYSNTIAQENVNIALSLQKAKSTMINGVYNNPYYWAPFVMWGK